MPASCSLASPQFTSRRQQTRLHRRSRTFNMIMTCCAGFSDQCTHCHCERAQSIRCRGGIGSTATHFSTARGPARLESRSISCALPALICPPCFRSAAPPFNLISTLPFSCLGMVSFLLLLSTMLFLALHHCQFTGFFPPLGGSTRNKKEACVRRKHSILHRFALAS